MPPIPPALSSATTLQHYPNVDDAHFRSAEISVRPHGYTSDNEVAIHERLNAFFAKHTSGDNHDEITTLIQDRAKRLHQMGETPESIEHVLAQAAAEDKRSGSDENGTKLLRNIVEREKMKNLSVPAAISSLMTGEGWIKQLSGGKSGASSYWLRAEPKELESVMAGAVQSRQVVSSVAGHILDNPEIQNALIGNAKRLGKLALGSKAPPAMMAGIAILGGAGIASGANHMINKKLHLNGPEFLFAKKEWETQFRELKEKPPTRQTPVKYGQLPSGFAQNNPLGMPPSLQGRIRELMHSCLFNLVANILTQYTANNEFASTVKSHLPQLSRAMSPTLDALASTSLAGHLARQLQRRLTPTS